MNFQKMRCIIFLSIALSLQLVNAFISHHHQPSVATGHFLMKPLQDNPSKTLCTYTRSASPTLIRLQASNSEEYTAVEIDEMRDLILSISKERDDEERRLKLSSLIIEKTSQEDVIAGARFVQLWDKMIIQVGGEVQKEAINRAKTQKIVPIEVEADPDAIKKDKPREKSEDELQLWALVDMMVQSKTIVKKAME